MKKVKILVSLFSDDKIKALLQTEYFTMDHMQRNNDMMQMIFVLFFINDPFDKLLQDVCVLSIEESLIRTFVIVDARMKKCENIECNQ